MLLSLLPIFALRVLRTTPLRSLNTPISARAVAPRLLSPVDDLPDEDAGQAGACCVCLDKKRVVILAPCGHMGLCGGCAMDLRGRRLQGETYPLPMPARCPLCRTEIAWQGCVRIREPGM